MDWIQVLTIIGANFGMFLWLRSEASSDRREIHTVLRNFSEIMRQESKDFHSRLAVIEERKKGK